MPVRVMEYEAMEYRSQLDEIARKHEERKNLQGNDEYLSRMKKSEIASKREDLLEILMVHGYVPEALLKRIDTENNLAVLKRWFKISIHTDSIEDFEAQMDEENVMD